jgi:hypothetical protein
MDREWETLLEGFLVSLECISEKQHTRLLYQILSLKVFRLIHYVATNAMVQQRLICAIPTQRIIRVDFMKAESRILYEK